MANVGKWISNLNGHATQIIGLLRNRSPEPAFEASVTQFIETNERTRSSITATIAPALSWLTHQPAQAAALSARDGGHPLDVEQLLAAQGSVFMLGAEEHHVAPLVCAMTGWIAREARRIAACRPGGRLDPPLGLRLDECALIWQRQLRRQRPRRLDHTPAVPGLPLRSRAGPGHQPRPPVSTRPPSCERCRKASTRTPAELSDYPASSRNAEGRCVHCESG